MHFDSPSAPSSPLPAERGPWYRGLTGYHWFVLVVASLGWLFDTMDQQLFILARDPAITQLLSSAHARDGTALTPQELSSRIKEAGGLTTMIFMIGWATGGLAFGVVGDRIGRAKTMILTILLYSLFTGLSALSVGIWDFAFYRFLTGLGVGGEFAVGVSLVAEVMPDHARPFALGWLQALSAIGNMVAALVGIAIGQLQAAGKVDASSSWRAMFVIGVIPALLALLVFRRLKEPERWQKAARGAELDGPGTAQRLGSIPELFGDPRWRRNALVGMLLAFAGVVGLWGIGFFSPELIRSVFRRTFQAQGLSDAAIGAKLKLWAGITSLLQNFGAFLGIYAFSKVTHLTGRRPAFAISFLLAMASTAFTFRYLNQFADVFWMIPLMGFCQLTLFGGYAIYFPELFPTRLRSTGTSFCYNVARFVSAFGSLGLPLLASRAFPGLPDPWPIRYAGVTMCGVFLVGLLVLPFAPETRGKPLPE